MLTMQRKDLLKKRSIRNAEYYNMIEVQDRLYAESAKANVFTDLISIIYSDANINMAYRNLKNNDGSNTPGVDGLTFENLKDLSEEKLLSKVRRKIHNYQPKAVRRVYIKKPNGKMRPLEIPTVIDRIVQQSILQELEPICEAKFYDKSYGFRTNRSTTMICADVLRMFPVIDITMKTRLNDMKSLTKEVPDKRKGGMDEYFYQRYQKSKQLCFVNGMVVVSVAYCKTCNPMCHSSTVNRYTSEGRAEVHRMLLKDAYAVVLLQRTWMIGVTHFIIVFYLGALRISTNRKRNECTLSVSVKKFSSRRLVSLRGVIRDFTEEGLLWERLDMACRANGVRLADVLYGNNSQRGF